MGIKGFEQRLERMVEGTFARVFKSGLQPVEVARRLTRQMDSSRTVGVSGSAVAPNHFMVQLSLDDHEQFADVSESLSRELADAAREHARDEGYTFLGPVAVEFVPWPVHRTGMFTINARMVEAVGGVAVGSLLLPTGDRVVLGESVVTIGRLSTCTIVLEDGNASRNHAEVRPSGTGYAIIDLASTNGTMVNGARITECLLRDGDQITCGATSFMFEAS